MPNAKPKPKNSTKVAKPDNTENILDQFNTQRSKRGIVPTSPRSKQDVFQCFRPKPGHCLDYHISQTIANLHAGRDTLINIKETTASYVPAPVVVHAKPKKRTKLFHGGPPCWEFLDEKWRKKQEVLQAVYKEDLKKLTKHRKKAEKKQGQSLLENMLSMVGPDWFQELSPKQFATVDNLAYCINKDILDKTLVNTQENIEQLGVHLLPNHRHIKRALRQCCGLPVEFLLVLYQLINPQRKSYSINDRLLLSAVVHLTMTSTLRELHVRIPSPPREAPGPPEGRVVVKKCNYASPYLEPFSFQPEPRKFTGVYKNKHIQYPESPYFSYIPQLVLEVWLGIQGVSPRRGLICDF